MQRDTTFGQLLRYWRGTRRMSQLALATEAEVSSRHVSFIENGRSRPSRALILQLAQALDVPLRATNQLLQAAGYAGVYDKTPLDAAALAPARQALAFTLEHHEPYPVTVVDRYWNVLLANAAATRLMTRFVADPAALAPPINAMRLLFSPQGARPFVVGWEGLARAMVQRVHRDVLGAADEGMQALLASLLAEPGVPEDWRRPDLSVAPPALAPMRFARDGLELAFFSMIATLGTPGDVTLQELRIELFYPLDAATDAALRNGL